MRDQARERAGQRSMVSGVVSKEGFDDGGEGSG